MAEIRHHKTKYLGGLSNELSGGKFEYAVRLLRSSGSPRPQGACDDKVWYFHHEGSEVIGAFTFVIARREHK